MYIWHHFFNNYFHSERKMSKDFKGKEYYGIQFKPEAEEDLEGTNDILVKLMFWSKCVDFIFFRVNLMLFFFFCMLFIFFLKVRGNWWQMLAARIQWRYNLTLQTLYQVAHMLQMCHSLRHNIVISRMFLFFFLMFTCTCMVCCFLSCLHSVIFFVF